MTATDDVLAFVRAKSEAGCGPDHSVERVLVVVNRAQTNRAVELTTNESALDGCTVFEMMPLALGSVPRIDGGKISIDEAGESMTLYRVR